LPQDATNNPPASATAAAAAERALRPPRNTDINDERLIQDLERLRELRSFLIQEAVRLGPDDAVALSFGKLNLLKYHPDGREPTEDEWLAVESDTRRLFGHLSDPLRRKFILGSIPLWMAMLPVVLAVLALASLILPVLIASKSTLLAEGRVVLPSDVLPFYAVWLMSLGAIGAVAFIGMNALSVQEDITFDLTNKRLMILRIALGALFALVLTLPFGLGGFATFTRSIVVGTLDADAQLSSQAIMLLLPFILGFSTSLVIMILNRLLDAVQAFFGKSNTADRQPPPAPVKQ